jgi:carboxymethylenebutenolidase
MISFRANGRTAQGYLATPSDRKGPGVLVIQEYWGLVDHIKDVADRFAREGFVALAPDLFHGEATRSPDQAGKMLMALNIAEAGKDMRGAGDALLTNDAVGFCMGGQLALFAAQEHPDKIAAAVDFYGVHPNVKIDPAKLSVPVLAHFAKRDEYVKEEDARSLVQRLESAGKEVEAYFYDAGHAFFNDQRPEAYDRASAEQAWERTLRFLREELR